MDEELIKLTEDIVEVNLEEVIESEVIAEDLEREITTEESVEIVDVEISEEIDIEFEDSIGWVGGDSTRHYSLYGRDESDQHPITAITGLRKELDEIEKLKTVYADKTNIANYYKWNNGAYNEYGYFVSLVPHTSKIKICDGADIFGVTVDVAGFIGGQDENVPRDNTYALVATSGLVNVRCETTVVEGDYVVSNAYGIAEKTDSSCGYKVVTIENKNGTNYALISLGIQACTTDMLGQQIQHLDGRMDDAESNIVAAMNVANAAYNKAGEVGTVSEEAIKNALEALNKSNETDEKIDNIEINVSSANEIAVQAKAISESAVVSAETIRNEAVKTANEALTDVNNLIEDLRPIYEWEDPITRNTGAEYFVTYIKDGVATKAEVQTVGNLTNDNKSAIEKSAEEFSSFVSSVDKYSVGEYSQAYGLTHEQAKSILKVGMVYIPADNPEGTTHIETYEGQGQDNYFTEGRYYEWDGDDWQEHTVGKVWISNAIPANSNGAYKYWYVDSNEAPEGYEAHALYIYDESQWKKVNILDGNVNNRITSMIRQTADEISAEVTNARGSAATLGVRITNTESEVQSLALWSKGGNEDGEQYNLATIKQTADDAGASIAQVVESVGKDGKVTAASIVTSINNDTTGVTIEADHIDISGKTIDLTAGNITIASDKFNVDKDGNIEANSGFLGGWKIDEKGIHSNTTSHIVDLWAPINKLDEPGQWIFMFTDNTGAQPTYPFVVQKDGALIANKATIAGDSNIGGWTISGTAGLIKENEQFKVHIKPPTAYGSPGTAAADFIVLTDKTKNTYPFVVTSDGTVKATKAIITGDSVIEGDCTVRGKLDGAGLVKLIYGENRWNSAIDFGTTPPEEAIDGEGTTGYIRMCLFHDTWQDHQDDPGVWNKVYSDIRISGDEVSNGPTISLSSWYFKIDAVSVDIPNASMYAATDIIEDSDKNLKSTISSISPAYSALFDSLNPVTFKLNNGTSGRLHTGFIAQEVDEAISAAGLTRQDFAGLCIRDEGTENERWGLRYGEFVALNTYEIQKLKARVAELEAKLENKEN